MKQFIISLLLVCSVSFTKAQKMEDVFVKMPDDMIVQLEEAWRKDLVGLFKSGKVATLENTMQGKSTLLKLTNDYMLLQSTERSTVELKLLPLVNNTNIICMIVTVYAPIEDSRVSFYTTEWQDLSVEGMFTQVTEDWFRKDDVENSHPELPGLTPGLDMLLVKYSLCKENTNLTAEYMTPRYLDEESRNNVKSLLKTDPKIYKWNLGHFE